MTALMITASSVTMTSEQLADLLLIEHSEFRKKANALAAKGLLGLVIRAHN